MAGSSRRNLVWHRDESRRGARCLPAAPRLPLPVYNHDVLGELVTGMPVSECLQGMAQGGTIWLQRELSLASAAARAANTADPCWSGAVEDRLWQCEASTGRCVESALVVGRHYGFAGYGSFVLFFDEHRQLVGSCLKHYN